MPYTMMKTGRRKKKKYTHRRRRRRRYPKLVSQGVPSGMPTIRVAKLRYCDVTTFNSNLGGLNNYIYRANSIWDPDQSGIGARPLGATEWSNLFNHYIVKGSRITATFMGKSGEASAIGNPPSLVGCYLTDSNTPAYSSSVNLIEARKGTHKSTQWRFMPIVRSNFSAKKFFNVTDLKDNINRLGAPVNNNPTEQAFYNLWIQGLG